MVEQRIEYDLHLGEKIRHRERFCKEGIIQEGKRMGIGRKEGSKYYDKKQNH